jgi:diketogulonate reductase-like aldo/keto reductase
MRYEEAVSLQLPKVGFGTWSIGGRETADRSQDDKALAVLGSALMLGYTHFDTAESYAAGHCEELLGRAIREQQVERSSLFLTSKVKPENLAARRVVAACEGSLKRLGTDYVDLYLIHWPNRSIALEETFRGLNQLAREGRIRQVGVSNFDLDLLKKAQGLSELPLFTNQVPMSLFERSYVTNGVVEYCQRHRILITAYSPLKHRQFASDAGVAQIAAARRISPYQVGLAWLCSQVGVITIPKSADPRHQRENLEAADVVLTPEEMGLLA